MVRYINLRIQYNPMKLRPLNTSKQMEYNRRWKEKNKDKVAAQLKRYRRRHPDKMREIKKNYLERKIQKELDKRCAECPLRKAKELQDAKPKTKIPKNRMRQ